MGPKRDHSKSKTIVSGIFELSAKPICSKCPSKSNNLNRN